MDSMKQKLKKLKLFYPLFCAIRSFFMDIKYGLKYLKADRIHFVMNNHKDDKKYLIYSYQGKSGLMTQLVTVLGWLKFSIDNGYLLVVDMTDQNNIYADGTSNAWEKFYKQPMLKDSVDAAYIESIKQNCNYAICPQNLRHTMRYEWVYRKIVKRIPPQITFPLPRDYVQRPILYAEYATLFENYMRYQPDVDQYLNEEQLALIKDKGRILGVLIRGSDYVQSKPFMHPVQPSVEQVIQTIDSLPSEQYWDYMYLATEEKRIAEKMEKHYPGRIIMNNRHWYDGDYSNQWIYDVMKGKPSQAFASGLEYLSSINILSKCDMLIGGLCGGTQAALIMNNHRYAFVHLFELGDYC